jgi:hypothetical protein
MSKSILCKGCNPKSRFEFGCWFVSMQCIENCPCTICLIKCMCEKSCEERKNAKKYSFKRYHNEGILYRM